MANIENLNFQVILNDSDFQTRINKDIEAANKLDAALTKLLGMRINAKPIISAAGLKNAQEMSKYLDQITQKIQSMPRGALFVGDAEKLNSTLAQVNASITKMTSNQTAYTSSVRGSNTALFSMSGLLRTLSMLTGTAFSVIGIRRFLSSLIRITGEFEVQRMALRSMLKDIDGADKVFEDLYRFSSDSTYRFSELAKYAKQLAGFQIGKDNLLETTKMLGDVASGIGTSMDRLILAYGHVKSSGFLRGIQLRSFSQNGVPILKELSDMFSEIENKAVSMGDIFDKMTKRQIPFEMVEEAFRRMTSEGGQFYQMQEVLAKTLSGQINILKGRWENMLAAIGESNSGVLKGTVEKMSELVLHHERLGKLLGEMVAVWGAYKAAVIATGLAHGNLAVITDTRLYRSLLNIGKWIATNPWAILAAAVTFFTIEIVKASKRLSDHERIVKSLVDVTDKYNDSVNAEIGELDALYGALKNAKEGTEEYDLAKRAIQKRFNPYIEKLREEGVEVSNLANIYQNLADKIINANKQKFLEQAQDALGDEYAKSQQNIEDRTKLIIANMGKLTADQEQAIRHYIRTGEMNDYFKSITNMDSKRAPGPYEGPSYNKRDDKTFREQLKELRLEYDRDTIAFKDSMLDAAKRFDAIVDDTTGKTTDALKGWRRAVQTALYTVDEQFEKSFMPKDDEDYFEFLERMGKHYKEVNEQKDKALQKDKQIYQNELDAIKKVDAALEGNILSDERYSKTPWKGGSSSSNPFADEISDTRARIALLEKFRSAYDKLEPILGPEGARAWVFNEMGYDVEKLDKNLGDLIAHLRTLGDEGVEAADAVEARLGLDKASKAVKEYNALQKKLKAIEKAQKELDKWRKEWGGNYSGFDGDLEKTFNKYLNEADDIEHEYNEALKEAAETYKDDAEALKKYTDELKRYYEIRKAANFNSGQNAIDDLVSKYVKRSTRGMSLSDWGDKSLKQVYGIYDTLNSMAESALSGGLVIDDKLAARIQAAGFSLEDFAKLSYDEFKKLSKEAKEELLKKVGKAFKEIASVCQDAASSVKEFAEAAGDMDLSATIDELTNFADLASSVVENVASGNYLGAVVSLFSWYTKRIFEAKTEAKKLEAALAEVSEEARRARMESSLTMGEEGIFGENGMQGVRKSIALIGELKKSMSEYYSEVSSKRFFGNRLGFFEWASEPNQKYRFLKLQEMAKAVGGDLYDAYGNLNAGTLQDILNTYENLDAEQRAWIEHAIGDSEAYAKAMEQIDQVAESILGDVVSNVTDKIVDSWWEAGRAALDYADILEDVAKSYAKLIVRDMLLDAAFDEQRQDAFKKALTSGDARKAMAIVEEAMQSAQDMLPAVESALQAFEPYRNMGGGDESNSVGNGIKNITEDTANLLASYINAIRADVSYMRGLQERSLEGVAALSGNIPTLNDYLAQCAANTYDVAQSNQSILAEIRSVIGAPGTSGMVVRVESY